VRLKNIVRGGAWLLNLNLKLNFS